MKPLLILASLTLAAGSAWAADERTCSQISELLWTMEEIAAEWSESSGANVLALTRLSMRATRAVGAAKASHATLPAATTTALETIQQSLAKKEGQARIDPDEVRPILLQSGIAIVAAMPEACPGADLPDLSAHLN